MRPTTHEVVLQGGAFKVPLCFATFQAINSAPLDPRPTPDYALGFIDSNAIVSGVWSKNRDPHPVVALRILHAALGDKSPGMEALVGMDTQRNIITAAVLVCSALVIALAPVTPVEGSDPKA